MSATKLNILDCDGYGLLNYFDGRCREGKYKDRDCLYIGTRTGEKVILISGGSKDGDEKYIKGNTYGMAYITEANECHPKYLKEVFDRTLSSKNRKIFHDLNPKGPAHWYYQDILQFHQDSQLKNPDYGYNYGHFTIADNMSMSEEKIKKELATYDKKSLWYQRDILGLRTPAEGLIYPMFSEEENTYDDSTRPPHLESYALRYATIDHGVLNPCAWLDVYDDNDTLWIDNEYRYDGRQEKEEVTNGQYADDFQNFFSNRPLLSTVVIDPAAASYRIELEHRGYTITLAVNDVIEGIQDTCSMIYNRKIKVHKRCKHLLEEIRGYIWDEKARIRGEEKPLKINDHECDCLRYLVETLMPDYRIHGQ